MWMNDYQRDAMRTANSELKGTCAKAYAALKLAGEAGELADLVGKHLGQGHPLDEGEVLRELGDIYWHLACAAKVFGFELDVVAQVNLDKLRQRYPEEFSAGRSINRR